MSLQLHREEQSAERRGEREVQSTESDGGRHLHRADKLGAGLFGDRCAGDLGHDICPSRRAVHSQTLGSLMLHLRGSVGANGAEGAQPGWKAASRLGVSAESNPRSATTNGT